MLVLFFPLLSLFPLSSPLLITLLLSCYSSSILVPPLVISPLQFFPCSFYLFLHSLFTIYSFWFSSPLLSSPHYSSPFLVSPCLVPLLLFFRVLSFSCFFFPSSSPFIPSPLSLPNPHITSLLSLFILPFLLFSLLAMAPVYCTCSHLHTNNVYSVCVFRLILPWSFYL